MKTHKVLFFALIVSAVFALSAQGGDRRRSSGNARAAVSAPARYSGSAVSSSTSFRYGNGRVIGSSAPMAGRSMISQRFAQRSVYSPGGNIGSFSQRQFTARTFTSRAGNGFTRFGNNVGTVQGNGVNRFANNRGFNRVGAGNHVFAQRSADWHRDWDRHRDHWWNGHRCRFVNGSWFIFDFGFVPWYGWSYYDSYPYDYYPYSYGAYGYGYGYDPGAYGQQPYYDQGGYDNGQSNYYDQGGYNDNRRPSYDDQSDTKSYDQGGNSLGPNERSAATIADVQDQLTTAGYYHGKIDGVLGPETRHALLRYQSAKGLRMTGSLTMETQQSLGLAQGGENVER